MQYLANSTRLGIGSHVDITMTDIDQSHRAIRADGRVRHCYFVNSDRRPFLLVIVFRMLSLCSRMSLLAISRSLVPVHVGTYIDLHVLAT